MKKLTVGTRRSELALTQTRWVVSQLQQVSPEVDVIEQQIVTKGDRILDVTLSKIGGKGLFVKEIEQALLAKEIDLAVHSLKDMPAEMTAGLVIGAIPGREDSRDGLITQGSSLDELPPDAVIGTSSLRRQAQVLARRSDVTVKPLRGNVGTRIDKLRAGEYDAIVLAMAGLNRLGRGEEVSEIFSVKEMLPAVGQGALAVQCRADDTELLAMLQKIHCMKTEQAVRAERALLQFFQGGCHLPIAAHAEWFEGKIRLTGRIADPMGHNVIEAVVMGQHPETLGKQLGERLVEQGADVILEEIEKGTLE